MRELAKAIGSFSWAMSLFGARQVTRLFRPAEAAEAFDGMAREASRRLGEELESTFELGDRMQRTMVDLTLGMVDVKAPDPDEWARASTQMAEGFAEMARRMADLARSWSERANDGAPTADEGADDGQEDGAGDGGESEGTASR